MQRIYTWFVLRMTVALLILLGTLILIMHFQIYLIILITVSLKLCCLLCPGKGGGVKSIQNSQNCSGVRIRTWHSSFGFRTNQDHLNPNLILLTGFKKELKLALMIILNYKCCLVGYILKNLEISKLTGYLGVSLKNLSILKIPQQSG